MKGIKEMPEVVMDFVVQCRLQDDNEYSAFKSSPSRGGQMADQVRHDAVGEVDENERG